MFTKECPACTTERQNAQQQEAAAVQHEREEARQKTIEDEFERIQVDVKRGLPCFLHTSQYISVDSEITKGLTRVASKGKKIALLTSTVMSPSATEAINKFTAAFSAKGAIVSHVTYDAVSASGMLGVIKLTFFSNLFFNN